MSDVRAALRDASFHHKPGWSGKYHVILDHDAYLGREIAACSPYRPLPEGAEGFVWPRMVLLDDTATDARHVPSYQRCGRPGCRQRWPDLPSTRETSR